MKIFSWMQSKLNGKQVMKKSNTTNNHHMGAQAAPTSKEEFSDWPQSLLSIGTFGISTMQRSDTEEISHPQTPTPEQVHEELISYLDTEEEEEEDPVFEKRQVHLQRSMFPGEKDILADHKNNVIRKKSLTFLLKKIFTSRSCRLNHVSLSLPDQTFDKSRMEKILRAILNKKIHPQTCSAKPMPNKYLGNKDISMDDDDNEGSTWVKTDSEYIVLEI